jgi:AraC family transcriptional regulator, regulatory protein of adaptative response / DNA-3-methyladenine glycosylase II
MTDAACYAALAARDPRFDGVFFVGVATTGIYCRPICPARTPGRTRCTYFANAVLAERAGFRACFRCRPELAPGHAAVDAVDMLVARAAQQIGEGALNTRSIEDLAATFGVSARHLRRALEARLGVSPIELAQSRRLALAKQLLHDTALPLTAIAFAAGFGSVRRFNAVFARRMGAPPSALRRRHVTAGDAQRRAGSAGVRAGARGTARGGDLALRLDYRAPYDWAHLLAFLRGRAIPGVELVEDDRYRRVVHLDGHAGEIAVAQRCRTAANRDALELVVSPSLLPVLMPLVARVRRMFDLDADPGAIERVLGRDRLLGPLVRAAPGVRVPGALDPFEASVRALLGQQVSVAAATTLAGRFAAALGAAHAGQGLTVRFPTAAEVALAGAARIARIGLPRTRAAAIHNLACVIERREIVLDAACDLDVFVARLVELPGIGPWTAHYLAMRALHVPDAFPAADLGVQKALRRSGPRAAELRAERWRPYRAYAVMHLWRSLGGA